MTEATEETTEEVPKKTRNRKPPSPEKKALAVKEKVRELREKRDADHEKFHQKQGESLVLEQDLIASLTDDEREILFRLSPELQEP